MKIDYIHPCICVEHLPDTGDSSYYGMPQLKVTRVYNGKTWYTPFCPNCGRGGLSQFKTPFQAFRHWNELQDRVWRLNDGNPDPYVRKEVDTLPRNGYDNWINTHVALGIAPGEHFSYNKCECRVRSDGNEILFYDEYEHYWSCPPGDCKAYQLEEIISHKKEIGKLPFEKWHVEADEPDHIWHRYVHERLYAEPPIRLHQFKISYLDGHDMRFKTFETEAASKEEALNALQEKYKPVDFDHQINEVVEIY